MFENVCLIYVFYLFIYLLTCLLFMLTGTKLILQGVKYRSKGKKLFGPIWREELCEPLKLYSALTVAIKCLLEKILCEFEEKKWLHHRHTSKIVLFILNQTKSGN